MKHLDLSVRHRAPSDAFTPKSFRRERLYEIHEVAKQGGSKSNRCELACRVFFMDLFEQIAFDVLKEKTLYR